MDLPLLLVYSLRGSKFNSNLFDLLEQKSDKEDVYQDRLGICLPELHVMGVDSFSVH